jgi:hypothetical protein
MTARFIVAAPNVTVEFTYISTIAKAQSAIGNAAHYLWIDDYGDHGTPAAPITWEQLTNQQKLNIVDVYLRQVILEKAKVYALTAAADAARAAADSGFDAGNELNNKAG